MLKFISLALSKPTKPCAPHSNYDPEAIRAIVGARSHGNVRLQKGLYYTQKDVDEKFARVRTLSFLD